MRPRGNLRCNLEATCRDLELTRTDLEVTLSYQTKRSHTRGRGGKYTVIDITGP